MMNQHDAVLSSRNYYSLRDYMFRVLSAPIISSTLKLQMQSQVKVMCRCGVDLNPLKDVQGQESTSLCHVQIRNILAMT